MLQQMAFLPLTHLFGRICLILTLTNVGCRSERSGKLQTVAAMIVAREGHTATLLDDGRVLLFGGAQHCRRAVAEQRTGSTELFVPEEQIWIRAAEAHPRVGHTATALLDGRVLVVGGSTVAPEIYSPDRDAWTATPAMGDSPESGHVAVLLPDGRVLVSGGRAFSGGLLAQVAVYSPMENRWEQHRPLLTPRRDHSVSLLEDGSILVVGGFVEGDSKMLATARVERYVVGGKPGDSSVTELLSLKHPRGGHGVVPTADGRLYLWGGGGLPDFDELAEPPLEFYSSPVGMRKQVSYESHSMYRMRTAVALDVGRVLSLAGSNGVAMLRTLNAASGAKSEAIEARQHGRATMTRLRDGSVLIAGGCWIDGVTRSAAIYIDVGR